jgi:hypothetical protein
LDSYYGRSVNWALRVGGAFPGFHDIYEQAGVGSSYGYLDARDGETLRETLGRAVEAGVDIVQLITWNDFGEGTILEPTEETGYRYLQILQEQIGDVKPLPFSAADLELPKEIYDLRRQTLPGSERDLRLDEVVSRLVAGDPTGARAEIAALTPTGVERPVRLRETTLNPNPSRGPVTISVALEAAEDVMIRAFDLLGRSVATIADSYLEAGNHRFVWEPDRAPPGLYYLVINAGPSVTTLAAVRY